MAKRIVRVYRARIAGSFKGVLPLECGIVYRNVRESHRKIGRSGGGRGSPIIGTLTYTGTICVRKKFTEEWRQIQIWCCENGGPGRSNYESKKRGEG